MRPSRLAICVSLFVVCSTLSACSDGLTEQSARRVVESVEANTKQSNFDPVATAFSDDCVRHESDPKPDGTGAMETNTKSCREDLDDMRSLIAAVASAGATHQYNSTVSTVEVHGDKAIVHVHVSWSQSQGTHNMNTELDQVDTLQLRNGKVLITAIDATTTDLTVDGRRLL